MGFAASSGFKVRLPQGINDVRSGLSKNVFWETFGTRILKPTQASSLNAPPCCRNSSNRLGWAPPNKPSLSELMTTEAFVAELDFSFWTNIQLFFLWQYMAILSDWVWDDPGVFLQVVCPVAYTLATKHKCLTGPYSQGTLCREEPVNLDETTKSIIKHLRIIKRSCLAKGHIPLWHILWVFDSHASRPLEASMSLWSSSRSECRAKAPRGIRPDRSQKRQD